MNVVYVVMQFPVPSETFLSLDVEALRKKNDNISVYGLRFKHKEYNTLMEERGHEGLYVSNFSFKVLFISLWFCFIHPIMFLSVFSWVIKNSFRTPKHLAKSFLLLPAVLGHFYKILKSQPDVVHLFWGHYPAMLGFLVKEFMPKTVISQFLGAHDLVTNYPGSISLAKEADLFFTHSRSNVPLLVSKGIDSNDINVVFRGTRLDLSADSSLQKFEKLSSPTFLTAARLIEEKGVDDVLRIFTAVLKEYPNAILRVAGDGPYKSQLIRLSEQLGCDKNVFFLGHITQSELIEKMASSHFFLLMSRYPSERLPNVVKEAMYQNCVVITTNTVGIDDLVDHKSNGFVVKKGDYASGISYVLSCIEVPVTAKSIAEAAKLMIIQDFDVDKSMQKYRNLWALAIKERCK